MNARNILSVLPFLTSSLMKVPSVDGYGPARRGSKTPAQKKRREKAKLGRKTRAKQRRKR